MEDPVTKPEPVRIDWPGEWPDGYGGWAILGETDGYSHPSAAMLRRRDPQVLKGEIAKIDGRRTKFSPDPRTPGGRYADPSKARTLEQVAKELPKAEGDAHIGRPLFYGYGITQTDGHYGICTGPGPTSDRGALFPGDEITWIGRLPPKAWQAYAPVRPFKHPKSHAILWIMGPKGYAWYAKGDPDLGEARGMYLISRYNWATDAPQEIDELHTIILADHYTWPLRGLDNPRVGIVINRSSGNPALVVEQGDTRIVIMGMDDGRPRRKAPAGPDDVPEYRIGGST